MMTNDVINTYENTSLPSTEGFGKTTRELILDTEMMNTSNIINYHGSVKIKQLYADIELHNVNRIMKIAQQGNNEDRNSPDDDDQNSNNQTTA
eukprot:1787760-Amphidinium_carterae.1